MKSLFGSELCNTGRQIEFDIAKAVCILGMVFVHCFEELSTPAAEESLAGYIMIIALDAIFGAATFMSSMGLGIAYGLKDGQDMSAKLMKRGVEIFVIAYVLGFIRYGLPGLIFLRDSMPADYGVPLIVGIAMDSVINDILQFAGLALFLFGLLKKLKLSDKGVFIVALVMSVIGSFVRFIYIDDYFLCNGIGLFVGTIYDLEYDAGGIFPLFNWFIFVVGGYLYGKALQRCKDINKYYKITLPISFAIIAVYCLICIPNRFGMMNENIFHYYQMTTLDAIICFIGMIFATSVYHFISLVLGDKVKKVIQTISTNINSVYCIHWVIIGFIDCYFVSKGFGLSTPLIFIVGCAIYIVANILAVIYKKFKNRKKAVA